MKKLTLVAAMLLYPIMAVAQQQCASYPQVVQFLEKTFGESRMVQGLSEGLVMELWASPSTRTWTLLAIQQNGLTCILGGGTNMEVFVPKEVEEKKGERM